MIQITVKEVDETSDNAAPEPVNMVAAKPAPFAQGDTVMLMSGGPAMTVCDLESQKNGYLVSCAWFADGEVRESQFSDHLLGSTYYSGEAWVIPHENS